MPIPNRRINVKICSQKMLKKKKWRKVEFFHFYDCLQKFLADNFFWEFFFYYFDGFKTNVKFCVIHTYTQNK
jgi:hypothetical protein